MTASATAESAAVPANWTSARSCDLTVDIARTPEEVWRVMADVERWPGWTPSILGVEALDGAPPRVGSRFRIRQPGFPAATWRVTAWEPRRGFTWISRAPGATVTAEHAIEPAPGGSRVALRLRYGGVLGGLLARWKRDLTARHVGREAAGFRARCEGGGTP